MEKKKWFGIVIHGNELAEDLCERVNKFLIKLDVYLVSPDDIKISYPSTTRAVIHYYHPANLNQV